MIEEFFLHVLCRIYIIHPVAKCNEWLVQQVVNLTDFYFIQSGYNSGISLEVGTCFQAEKDI